MTLMPQTQFQVVILDEAGLPAGVWWCEIREEAVWFAMLHHAGNALPPAIFDWSKSGETPTQIDWRV